MIYAIYQYGLRMEAIGFLDMYMFWHLQFSVSGFAIFGDSLYRNLQIVHQIPSVTHRIASESILWSSFGKPIQTQIVLTLTQIMQLSHSPKRKVLHIFAYHNDLRSTTTPKQGRWKICNCGSNTSVFQKLVYHQTEWTRIDNGIEVGEFTFSHQSVSWGGERRYVMFRQEIRGCPKATGKQLSLFKDEDYGKECRQLSNRTRDICAGG